MMKDNTFLQDVPYSIMFKANDDGVTVDELKMFYESDIIAALTKLTEGNMLLNANGELIGHPLEMQLRQRFREVCKHHGFPSNNVAEADMVRAALAAFQVLVTALTTQVAELKAESLVFMAKADDRAETLVKELVLVGSSLTATEDEVTALRKRVAQLETAGKRAEQMIDNGIIRGSPDKIRAAGAVLRAALTTVDK